MEMWSTDLADIYVVYLPEDIECIPIIDSMFVASIFHISNSYSSHCFGAFYLITGVFINKQLKYTLGVSELVSCGAIFFLNATTLHYDGYGYI